MTVDLAKFLPMFFQETEEHLASMEQHLLALNPDAPDPEALHSIFRAAHSVKGNSTIFGADRFSEVMHRVETILDAMRREELKPTREVVSILLEACDGVREELRRFKERGQTDPDALQLVYDRLTALAPGEVATEPARDETHRGRRSERLRVEVDLPAGKDITALPLAALYAELAALGRVEDLHTGNGALGEPALSLFLLTPEPEAAVQEKLVALLGGENVRVQQHKAAPLRAAAPPLPGPDATAYGLFSNDASATRTNVLERTHFGRRGGDRESTAPTWGRRASDRLHLDRSTIRVDTEKVDRLLNLVGELVIAHSMLSETALRSGARNGPLRDSVNYVGRQTRDLQDAVMSIRLLPIDVLFSRMPRLVRDLAERLGKEVELIMHGGETELDKEVIEKLADPLTHLVRNALDHGMEPPEVRERGGKARQGRLELRASHQSGSILVEVRDDGGGFDRERILLEARERGLHVYPGMPDDEVLQLVFTPGFSTAQEVSDVSGRGVGMDIVKRNISALGGNIEIESQHCAGTTIRMRLPLTLAIMDGMSVDVGGETFIIPLSFISEAFLPRPEQIKPVTAGPQVVRLRDDYIPLLTLEQLIDVRGNASFPGDGIAIVVEFEGRRAAIAVDRLLGQQQVVIKNLEQNYRRVPGIGGATVLGNGRVALILDINTLLRLGLAAGAASQSLEAELRSA